MHRLLTECPTQLWLSQPDWRRAITQLLGSPQNLAVGPISCERDESGQRLIAGTLQVPAQLPSGHDFASLES